MASGNAVGEGGAQSLPPSARVRIKICGFTRADDLAAAADLGVDAVGLVFYPKSPRYVSLSQAERVLRACPPYVQVVGLFVNAEAAVIDETLSALPIACLQFHGDETAAEASRWRRPWVKVGRVRPGFDFAQYVTDYVNTGLTPPPVAAMFDAWSEAYGGVGQRFDWSQIPPLPLPLILSGGLTVDNVAAAIAALNPAAVDVSSAVEVRPGVKDPAKMQAFIQRVMAVNQHQATVQGDDAPP